VLERAAVQTKYKNGRIRVVPRRRDPFVPEAKGDFVNKRGLQSFKNGRARRWV
jgi:hypothetical protein